MLINRSGGTVALLPSRRLGSRADLLFLVSSLTVCALCLALRAYRAGAPWLDEAFTLLLASRPPSVCAYLSYVYDLHGPVYYCTLSLVREMSGSSFFTYYHSYFLLVMLVLLMTVPRIRGFPRRECMVAAGLLVIMPYTVLMADEMRMYIFCALLSFGAWLCLVEHRESGRKSLLLLAVLLAALAAYAHIAGFLVGISAIVFLAVESFGGLHDASDPGDVGGRRRAAVLFALIFVAVALAAIANFAWRAAYLGSGGRTGALSFGPGGIRSLGLLVFASETMGAGLAAAVALGIVAAGGLARRGKNALDMATMAGFVAVPVGAVVAFGTLGQSVGPRAGFYGIPFLALLMARHVLGLKGRWRPFAMGGALALFGALSLHQAATATAAQDYGRLTAFLETMPRAEPIGFLHPVDLWMVAEAMGAQDVEPERLFKPLTAMRVIDRSVPLRRILALTGAADGLTWDGMSEVEVDGRTLRLVEPGKLAGWPYDTPVVSSWGRWGGQDFAGCRVRLAGFTLYLRKQAC